MRRFLESCALSLLVVVAGCGDTERLIASTCFSDDACPTGTVCSKGDCVPVESLECDTVAGGEAFLQPGPRVVDFGKVRFETVNQTVTLRNIGSCTLTIFEARLGAGAASPFVCEGCAPGSFPIEIFPMREQTLSVAFTAREVGSYSDTLAILSDDTEFPEVVIPLRARFEGVPALKSNPEVVEFGFVDVNRSATRVVQLTNHGTGVAAFPIAAIRLETAAAGAFTISKRPTQLPVELAPVSIDTRANLELAVDYHPREQGRHAAELVLETPDPFAPLIRIPINGISETPPALSVSPATIDFGAVKLGEVPAPKVLTIVNNGGSPLVLNHTWNRTGSRDFAVQPAVLPAIEPGKFLEIDILLTPTAPGSPSGLLLLTSNDPSRPAMTVPVSAQVEETGTQVVKIELNYDNGSDSAFDDDLRNVDMILEHPWGFVCGKQDKAPAGWGDYGTPTWLSLGPKEEPERIILVAPNKDGRYRVLVQYAEDCSFLPSQLLASLLGVSVEALVLYFSGGTMPGLGDAIGGAIDGACFNHSKTTGTVTVTVNGVGLKEIPISLERKGDFFYALDLVRTNGKFTVE